MENSYGFEVSMSCVYNSGEGYDAGINVTTSDGRAANFECSADTMNELYDKLSTEGIDTILPVLFQEPEPEPKTLEEQIAELTEKVNALTQENEQLRAQADSFKSRTRKTKTDTITPDTYNRLLRSILQ